MQPVGVLLNASSRDLHIGVGGPEPINGAAGYTEMFGDGGRAHRGGQGLNLCRVDARWPTLVFGLVFGLGDALALVLALPD